MCSLWNTLSRSWSLVLLLQIFWSVPSLHTSKWQGECRQVHQHPDQACGSLEIHRNYPEGNYVWQQDGVPCHIARKTDVFGDKHDRFLRTSTIWTIVSRHAWLGKESCSRQHASVPSRKASIKRAWAKMDQYFIKRTCRSFHRRQEAILDNEGRIILRTVFDTFYCNIQIMFQI